MGDYWKNKYEVVVKIDTTDASGVVSDIVILGRTTAVLLWGITVVF